SAIWDPMKPAPPVTKILISLSSIAPDLSFASPCRWALFDARLRPSIHACQLIYRDQAPGFIAISPASTFSAEAIEELAAIMRARDLPPRARRHYNTIRPHASLGYKPPAPQVFVPAFAAWPAALRQPAPPATLAQRPALN